MFAYALRRIAGLVPTLFVLASLSFFVIRLAPGNSWIELVPTSGSTKFTP